MRINLDDLISTIYILDSGDEMGFRIYMKDRQLSNKFIDDVCFMLQGFKHTTTDCSKE